MPQERYFAADAAADKERRRLTELERQLDPMARQAFARVGLREGDRVLEVGPGAGSMLRWCAGQVGPQGRVVGLDLDPRFLGDLDLPNATVVRGDILDAAAAPGPFDIVYARYVIMHLPDTALALRRLLGRLRPGGAVILIDPDFQSLRAAAPGHPDAETFDRELQLRVDVLRNLGLMELNFARRLPSALDAAGCTDIDSVGTVWIETGGSPNARFWHASAETSGAAMRAIAPGEPTAEDVVLRCYLDPTFRFCSPIHMVVTARGPARAT